MSSGNSQTVAVPATSQIVVHQQTMFGRLGKWLFAALVLCVIAMVALYGKYNSYFSPSDAPQEKYHSLSRTATKKIAVITVSGTILDADGFAKKQIDRVREDDDVVAIVLRIDSPGGTVTASDYIYHHLRELAVDRELPLVTSMGGLCASGGYYIAMAVGGEPNTIFAEPSTWTGSIGVLIPHYDISEAIDYLNIKDDSLVSGPRKLMGTPTRPMSEEDRALLQGLVDDSFARFKEIVISGRPKFKDDAAALDAAATGQIFTANQALDLGMVDKIGFIEPAIERAAELAGYSTSDLRCVKYERPPSLLGGLMGASATAPPGSPIDLAALLNLATPRAYYLWTWLPAAMANSRH
jgi:protease IV